MKSKRKSHSNTSKKLPCYPTNWMEKLTAEMEQRNLETLVLKASDVLEAHYTGFRQAHRRLLCFHMSIHNQTCDMWNKFLLVAEQSPNPNNHPDQKDSHPCEEQLNYTNNKIKPWYHLDGLSFPCFCAGLICEEGFFKKKRCQNFVHISLEFFYSVYAYSSSLTL